MKTGSKVALPIFENFVRKAIKKSEARPFKSPDNYNDGCNSSTGQKAKFSSKDT